MNIPHPFIILTLTLLLVSCTTFQPKKSSNVADTFSDASPRDRSNAQTPAAITDALVPDFNQALSPPKSSTQQTRLNISVNGADAREFFMGLVVDTEENMLVHPEVTGTISLDLKNVTIPQVLDAVQKLYGYDYKKNDMGYIIYPATLQTKSFKIDRLDLLRIGNSNTSVSSGRQGGQTTPQGGSSPQGSGSQGSGGGSGGGNPQGSNPQGNNPQGNTTVSSSSSSVRTITKTDF